MPIFFALPLCQHTHTHATKEMEGFACGLLISERKSLNFLLSFTDSSPVAASFRVAFRLASFSCFLLVLCECTTSLHIML